MRIIPLFICTFFAILVASCRQTDDQLMDKAYRFYNQKKYDKSIEVYSEIIQRNNKLQLPYYNRGLCYINMKNYPNAIADFNKVISLQTNGDFVFTVNPKAPFANEEARFQAPCNDALYQRAQVRYYMDSLKVAFHDFQSLMDNNYQKSNCLLWQGAIWERLGDSSKACRFFEKGKEIAITDVEQQQAAEMINTYCR